MKPTPYTTNLGWNNYLAVSVLVHGEHVPLSGRVAEINIEGVAVIFPNDQSPDLHPGESVTLRLEATWLPRALVTAGQMASRMKTESGTVYRFEFSSKDAVGGQITPILHSIFNRRIAPRVVPAPEDAIEVEFHDGEEVLLAEAPLAQISSTGLACFLEGTTADFPVAGESVRVSFLLPGRTEHISFRAVVRTCRADKGRTVVGVEFTNDGTPQFSRQQGAVLGFVLARAPVATFMG